MEGPIFIGGDGRSGTTLLNVILDSHPNLSVAPEYHFRGGPDLGPTVLKGIGIKRDGGMLPDGPRAVDTPEWKPTIQFINRVVRAGVSLDEIEISVLAAMDETKTDLIEFDDRCSLIGRFGSILMNRAKKKRWGMKIMREIKNPQGYAGVWPDCQILHIIRDGRDVSASQILEHGSWGYGSISEAAASWANLIESARKNSKDLSYHEVRYEDIVRNPRPTLVKICDFLGVEWDKRLLSHEDQEHYFFNTKVAHPSRDRTMKKIDDSAVGRYRNDLTREQIDAFNQVSGSMLKSLRYEL